MTKVGWSALSSVCSSVAVIKAKTCASMCLFDVKHFIKYFFFFDTRKTCGCRDEFGVSAVIINLPNFRKAAGFFFFLCFFRVFIFVRCSWCNVMHSFFLFLKTIQLIRQCRKKGLIVTSWLTRKRKRRSYLFHLRRICMLTDIKGMMFRSRFNFLTFYAGIIFFIFLNDNYVSLFYHYCCTYGFFGGSLNHNTQKKCLRFMHLQLPTH